MGNEITTIENCDFNVDFINTLDDVKVYIEKLVAMEKALKKLGQWEKNIKKYCALEAETFCQIAEKNLIDAFAPSAYKKRGIVTWLMGLTPEERKAIVSECFESGIRIADLYVRDYETPRGKEEAKRRIDEYHEYVLNKFNKEGIVELDIYDEYLKPIEKYMGSQAFVDVKDGMRKKLRQNGAHGIGSNSQVYATAKRGKDYQDKMLENKINGIVQDVIRANAFKRECEEDGEFLPIESAIIERTYDGRITEKSAVNVALGLCGLRDLYFKGQKPIVELRTINALLHDMNISLGHILDLIYYSICDDAYMRMTEFTEDSKVFADRGTALKACIYKAATEFKTDSDIFVEERVLD